MPRKSDAEVIAELEKKLEAKRQKQNDKSKIRTAKLVEQINAIDEQIKKAEVTFEETFTTITTRRDERIAKLEAKRADLEVELQSLVVTDPSTTQLSFSGTEVDEV